MNNSDTLTGKPERAPVGGGMDSDIPNQTMDEKRRSGDLHLVSGVDKDVVKTSLDGKRGRAFAKGVQDSDVPAHSSDITFGGVVRGALGTGKGKREQAPAKGAEVSDTPLTLLDTTLGGDFMDASETLTGKRERAPAGGVADSDVPGQSVSKKCRLGDLHLAVVMDKDVAQEHA